MTKTNNKKGFTIIEVVLVLAIAGLIFLMVFIALPALQRSQRNTRRRSDMARILSAVTDYQAANGRSPVTYNGVWNGGTSSINANQIDTSFVRKYIDETCDDGTHNNGLPGNTSQSISYEYNCSGDKFKDPDGSNYSLSYGSGEPLQYIDIPGGWLSTERMRENHLIYMATGSKCSGDEAKPVNSDATSGTNNIALVYVLEGGAIYCGDNQ